MRYLILLQLLWLALIASCGGGAGGVGSFLAKGDAPAVSSVNFANDQLIINGSNLAGVTSVSVEGEDFDVESISETQLVVNAQQALAFIAGATYNLLVSNAFGAASYSITFTPDNNSITTNMIVDSAITTNKIADEAITESKLSDMGASDGDFLQWDQTTTSWIPTTLNGLTYLGTWDATTAAPTDPNAGEYYVISVAGDTDLGTQTAAWSVGDWAIYNGTDWQKIDNSNAVTNVFGRQGAISAVEGDYNIDHLGDVDTTTATPADGQVLTWDNAGGKWIPATESDPKVGTLTNGKWCTTDGNVINCEAAPGAETDPIFGAHVASSITDSGSGVVISVAERNGITNNASSISTNATNIATNDSDIATNVTNISTNATNISLNDTDIATNVTNISTNTTNISLNDTDIATNATNISSNDTDIATNVTNISTNATNIGSNDTDIAANTTAIGGKVDLTGATGQTIVGGTADNSNLTLTSSSGTPGYVLLNPNGGLVGIGTATPTTTLDVQGNARLYKDSNSDQVDFALVSHGDTSWRASYLSLTRARAGNTATVAGDVLGTVQFVDGSLGMGAAIQAKRDASGDGMSLNFETKHNGGAADINNPSIVISSNGNLGIGSTSPDAKLDVAGDIYAQQICDENGANCNDLSSGAIAVSGDISAGGGNVSVGTTDSTYNITFEGDNNQTIGVVEHSTAAGSSLTVSSGSAATGSTDQNGGNLVLSSGSSTGNGGSSIEFKTATSSGTPGTTATATPSIKMVIQENGNVGIGTTVTEAKLAIEDTSQERLLFLRGADYDKAIRWNYHGLKMGTVGYAHSTLHLVPEGSTSGNVRSVLMISDTDNAPTDYLGWLIGAKRDDGDVAERRSIEGYATDGTTKTVQISATGDSFLNAGKLGIGTTGPQANLEIYSNGTPPALMVTGNNAVGDKTTVAELRLVNYYNWLDGHRASIKAVTDYAGSSGHVGLKFSTSRYSGSHEEVDAMYIDRNGNVGIGTTAPVAKLDVVGSIRQKAGSSLSIFSTEVGKESRRLTINPQDADLMKIYNYDEVTPGYHPIQIGSNVAGTGLTVLGSGNVGITTTTPAERLHVVGDVRFTRESGGTNYLEFTSTASGSFITANDPGANQKPLYISAAPGATPMPIYFRTNNTHRLAISGDGNVGIGTISPTAQLFLKDGTGMAIQASNAKIMMSDIGNTMGLRMDNSGNMNIVNGSYTPSVTFINGGNVGIGTVSPGAKMHVYNSGQNTLRVQSETNSTGVSLDSAADVDSNMMFVENGSTKWLIGNDASDDLFRIRDATGTASEPNVMVLTNSGNVGIGTTSPAAKLTVQAGTHQVLMDDRISWSGGSSYPTIYGSNTDEWVMYHFPHVPYLENGQNGFAGASKGAVTRYASNTTASSHWDVGVPYTLGTDKFAITREGTSNLVIDSSGNVGIGITSPDAHLAVGGAGAGGNPETFIARADTAASIGSRIFHMSTTGASALDVGHLDDGTQNKAVFRVFSGNGSTDPYTGFPRFQVNSNGNVGIGTGTPSYKLDVASGWVNSVSGYKTNGADYAEYFLTSAPDLKVGTIVGINPETGLARAYRDGDQFIGIVATGEGFIGNSTLAKESSDDYLLVGLVGQLDFLKEGTMIVENILYVGNGVEVGTVLANGKVFVGAGSKREIATLKAENKKIKEFLCSKYNDAPICD